MAVPTHQEARSIITPGRERSVIEAFRMAWSDWESCPDRASYSRWPRTRANMVFERLAARLQEVFVNDSGVRFVFKDETIKVVFDDLIVARVKKANGLGVGENIKTEAVAQFVEAQLEIDGLSGLKKIEVVYVLNRLQSAVRNVVAQARDGDMQVWVWTLGGDAAGAEIVPFPLPLPPAPSIGQNVADEVVASKRRPSPDEATERD